MLLSNLWISLRNSLQQLYLLTQPFLIQTKSSPSQCHVSRLSWRREEVKRLLLFYKISFWLNTFQALLHLLLVMNSCSVSWLLRHLLPWMSSLWEKSSKRDSYLFTRILQVTQMLRDCDFFLVIDMESISMSMKVDDDLSWWETNNETPEQTNKQQRPSIIVFGKSLININLVSKT